ncbi:hypothetical protein F9K33_15090 [bacterium]|nr:MAG: hypothetical protein F9K33_15090 [bacterium]
MKSVGFIFLVCLAAQTGFAQRPDNTVQVAEMKKLTAFIGDWSGEGWIEYRPGQRSEFRGKETILPKLSATVIHIEGIHTSNIKGQDVVVHDALGIISFDPNMKQYRFRSYLATGVSQDNELKMVSSNKFEWGFGDDKRGYFQFTIDLSDPGKWVETGMKSADGATWQKFFEMKLERQKL